MKTRAGKPGFIPPRAGFTLIELLVVIAIIGVLFAVAMPVFENAGKKDTERAAFQVMSTLRLARQHAIAKRQWTMVIFPNRDGGAYDAKDLDKCLRGYAVIAATNNLDGEYKFSPTQRDPKVSDMQLAFVSDWKYLPEGIYFDDDKNQYNNWIFGAPAQGKSAYTATFRFPIDPAKPNELVRPMGAVMYKPNGRGYAMFDSSTSGSFWQDADYIPMKQVSTLYITSAKFYEKSGLTLADPKLIPGTNTLLHLRGKTGQVNVFDGIWE